MDPAFPPFSTHDPEILRVHADAACALLKALSNTDRLMLLCCMAAERRNVGELEAATGIHQPSLSQQLAVLRQEGLAATEKEGKYVYYRLSDAKASRLMQTLAEIFCAAP
ncbi:MAG: metalloregulator ArsR/SmtB family transcription factor [Zoogloeaceae bacterium]|jgi:DNA-binding transcriptional ArsR family regulator|nr:metalloregulator ArsR/SmtB family transcription factor [Zoogloeaceae bacterium]